MMMRSPAPPVPQGPAAPAAARRGVRPRGRPLRPRGGAAPGVDFNRDVRPILSGTCFKCHGIDDASRKAKLRLDVRDAAVAPLKDGDRAIVPGKPELSELVRRVFSGEEDEVMPPAKTGVRLTDAQKNTLKQWVTEGAKYETHWAFVAPKQIPPPAVKNAEWCRNPIDRFVLAKLEQQGLGPTPEADRYELVRRVYLDLIGLPPTPAEADAFVKDPAPDAFERLVDQLLASPHYGERWARRWLDLARYADTNGFEKDRPRDHLALPRLGDQRFQRGHAFRPVHGGAVSRRHAVPERDAERSQTAIATGFHRNTMLNEEGGIDPQEYRFLAMVDRTATTGTAWLGLTVGCAQCHTHKFDPITQRDYYRLMACLNNADEPEMEIPDPAVAARRAEVEEQIRKLTDALPDKFPVAEVAATWETPPAGSTTVTTAGGSVPRATPDNAWRFTGPSAERDTYTLEFDTGPATTDRLKLETLSDGAAGPGRTPHGNYVLSHITVTAGPKGEPGRAADMKLARAEADLSQAGFPVADALSGKPGAGWAVDPGNGQKITGHTATFFFDKPVHFEQGTHWTVRLDQQYGRRHTIAMLRLSLGAPTAEGPIAGGKPTGTPPGKPWTWRWPDGNERSRLRRSGGRCSAPTRSRAASLTWRCRATIPSLPAATSRRA